MLPKENISSKALLISLPGKFVVFMMETELYFKYSLFCMAPILWKARSFQQFYRGLSQITITLNNKML